MRINHNIAALNTYRQLSSANNAQSKSMEKLSSGLRINRAGDDAAGLAISEKMRGQIRGLDQATRNSQDGISMIQTAEGALNETHSILQRMRELAVQSANDTNTASDRKELQKEVDELAKEITRIGETTEFNTQNLLDGTFQGTFQIGANEGQNITLDINDMKAFSLGVLSEAQTTFTPATPVTITDTSSDGINGGVVSSGVVEYTVSQNNNTDKYEIKNSDGIVIANSDDGKAWTSSTGDDTFSLNNAATAGDSITIDYDNSTVDSYSSHIENKGLGSGDYTLSFTSGASTIVDSEGNTIATASDDTTFKSENGDTVLVLGSALTADAQVSVGGIDISSQTKADQAITTINNAIESVSAERSKMGAYQNRLEHTINNLGTSAENLTAAESRIRDVDMASEMMSQTKNSILAQAAQAMLAQSNQIPQGVLQLLR